MKGLTSGDWPGGFGTKSPCQARAVVTTVADRIDSVLSVSARRPLDNGLTPPSKKLSQTMLSCARVTISRASFRPSVASRSLATVSNTTTDTSGIPIVDFANFGSLSFTQRRDTAREVVDGFKNTGFVYLGNHGIRDKVVREAFRRVRPVNSSA